MARLKAVRYEDRLTLVEHLDELRTRIIVSVAVFVVALSLCFWQNELMLEIANTPLPDGFVPTTFGVAEPFTTTLTVSTYGALLLSLPIILYQAYAYIVPAFSSEERRVVTPMALLIPALFIGGVAFSYFVVMPPAIDFLLHFNDDQFDTFVRARDYYSFFWTTLLALGLMFEIPVLLLAVTRLGIVTPDQLARNRRYAILIIAVLVALLPSIDPVTLVLQIIPVIALYEVGIVLARRLGRPRGGTLSEPSTQER
jgi:sec-independent protein translocase protein TatC